MKITLNQLRRIIKEEVNRVVEGNSDGGEDYSSWKGKIHDEEEEIFPNRLMSKLPQILTQAAKNAEKYLSDYPDTPAEHKKRSQILIKQMKDLATTMKSMLAEER